jgi:hypothetical protein
MDEAGRTRAPGLSTGWCAALVLLVCVPLLYPIVPPLTDLPAHMARFLIQTDGGRSPELARWYAVDWTLIPNLGADLLAQILVPWLGLAPAVKAIAVAIVALQAAGYLLLSRVVHGRVSTSVLFALPLAYGEPFQYGFLNFTFAVALATLALALWLSPAMTARPRLRWIVFGPIATIVWVCHLAGWAALCLTIGTCELVSRLMRSEPPVRALAGGFVACSSLLLPQVAAMLFLPASAHLPTTGFFLFHYKLRYLFDVLADRWVLLDVVSAGALIALIVVARRSRDLRFDPRLAAAAGLLFAVFLVMPAWVFGSFYADMRLLPTAFAIAIIAIAPVARTRAWHFVTIAGAAFLVVRVASTTVSMAMWDGQLASETRVLGGVPVGSQLVTLNARPCADFAALGRDRDTHVASFALIRRRAFANDQFQMPGGQLLRVANPALRPFEADPSNLTVGERCDGAEPLLDDLARIPPAAEHLWIVWSVPEHPLPGWHPVRWSGGSILYRRAMDRTGAARVP